MFKIRILIGIVLFILAGCREKSIRTEVDPPAESGEISPFWKNAVVYFLLTDRFYNGDPGNDLSFNRKNDGAVLRNFMGGDIQGITQKIEEGYFDSLGVQAIWFSPVVEQIHGPTDEGTGRTYGYHGYWTRDWTRLDPDFGTEDDLRNMVSTAHRHGIRILMDVVINHTGPVTPQDPQWPGDWVRTNPTCGYQDYASFVSCTLVPNLPDIRTEREEEVSLPPDLLAKWEKEGRLEEELQELDEFFRRTGYPRAPKYYIIKWLTDWVRELGIDGFRVDTAKHTEASVWSELKKEAVQAFQEWKNRQEASLPEDEGFFMLGEVYGYGINGGRYYDYGDQKVDFFHYGFESLINFSFPSDARMAMDSLFQQYSDALSTDVMKPVGVINYVSSHDDASPFDPERKRAKEAGTRLLLTPGAVQIYYGDETARPLKVEGAVGDANLRSFMNWEDLEKDAQQNGNAPSEVLDHWRKLGRFRSEHLSVGAGAHLRLQEQPYIFRRTFRQADRTDRVIVAMDLPKGKKTVPLFGTFPDGTRLKDYYSGAIMTVAGDTARFDSSFDMVLLGEEPEK